MASARLRAQHLLQFLGTAQGPAISGVRRPPSAPVTILLAILYSLPAAVGLRPIVDLDIWWHLRQAAWIVENSTLPLTDPFTSYGAGKTWIAYSWLYELSVYALYRAFGLFGIALYTTILAFAITAALHRMLRRNAGDDLVVATGLTVLAVAAMYPVMTQPRPWLFNVLFLILELTVILDVRRTGKVRSLWALPPLFLVWACINIQFVYGLFVLALAAGEPLIRRWVASRTAEGSVPATPILIALAACTVATCLTPYHIRIYVPVVTAIRLTDPFVFLAELQAPPFRLVFDWVMFGLLLGAAFMLGRAPTISPFFVMLLVTGSFVAFRARRDVWLVVNAAVSILAAARVPYAVKRAPLGVARISLIAVVVLCVSVGLGLTRTSGPRLERAVAETFPVKAAAFIEKQGYRGRLYNDYNWGGYLMWRLPQLDVSLDGRNPVHGDERIWASIRTFSGAPGWSSDPELVAANVVIASVTSALSSLLRHDARFVLVYEDGMSTVFVARREPRASSLRLRRARQKDGGHSVLVDHRESGIET
jgi:hypothetical protein